MESDEQRRTRIRKFVQVKLDENGLRMIKEIKIPGFPYQSVRQAFWQNRFPRKYVQALADILCTTVDELVLNGLGVVDIKERIKISPVAKVFEKTEDQDVLPLIRSISKSGSTSCTLVQFAWLVEIQARIPQPLSPSAVAELLKAKL